MRYITLMSQLMIGWTTVAKEIDAQKIARDLIAHKYAACVHIEGPITACYNWEGNVEKSQEYKLAVKFLSHQATIIKQWLHEHHPYETPQWIVVEVTDALPAYESWALSTSRKNA